MKYLIFDAGPIISLTMNGLLGVVEKLKQNFDGEFILTPNVKREVVDRPLKIKKYKWEALQVKDLIDRKIFRYSTDFIPVEKLDNETKRITKIANSYLFSTKTGEKINLIHEGEAACLAFASLCKCENVIVIDERTTRMLTESPKNLRKMMERKLHFPLKSDNSKLSEFKKFKFIRSTELIYIAYKKGLLLIKSNKETLDSILYSLKFKGTAISTEEIEEIKKRA